MSRPPRDGWAQKCSLPPVSYSICRCIDVLSLGAGLGTTVGQSEATEDGGPILDVHPRRKAPTVAVAKLEPRTSVCITQLTAISGVMSVSKWRDVVEEASRGVIAPALYHRPH